MIAAPIVFSGALALAACSNSDRYDEGYEKGFADAEAESQRKIELLERVIEDAESEASNVRSAFDDAQAAAAEVKGEAERFSYEDWQYVVGSVQGSASEAEDAVDQIGESLGSLESTLASY
ncbi:chromosome segregation ATPase [Sphingobium sp. B2D3A]|uniref:hypothetical protein n=1 Tax=unclassified Sphingobium TaxID=2611147 RepID=UPI0022250951|nr:MULTISPECIES: hypothetical protein [unclassified Sphingobium]MCW2336289.1 chromosome segregation ATPase [Sphingobium sp. B2D3A]MCW2386044.1 chromosome segregation ATPase [Sphingobium sp. B2D3D]